MSKQGKSKDLAEELKEYLSSYGIVKREDIINAYESHRSKRTIIRRLDELKDAGFIDILKAGQVEKYGIEAPNKKFKYVVLKQSLELIKHIDSVLELFDSGDDEDKLTALAEIDSYKNVYSLYPSQLDVLVRNLDEDNIELTYYILVILSYNIIDKWNQPRDVPALLDKLRILLAKISSLPQKHSALRGHVIALLGIYEDGAVIDQLTEDARTMDDLSNVKDEYDKRYTAKVIESHRTVLFDLEIELRKDGKNTNAKVLSQIRYQAKKNLGLVESGEIPGVDLK
ncbi:hypothetical protein [Methanolobus sp. ZRKC5]|uniref:hypothetical protein n=1 Tax=unclassified Methanolobus TaxID=2629569 RepID=UPI00313E10E6